MGRQTKDRWTDKHSYIIRVITFLLLMLFTVKNYRFKVFFFLQTINYNVITEADDTDENITPVK